MTDFLNDLRRDLLDAAERDARTPFVRRLRVPVRPVFAVVSAAAMAAVVLTVAATLSADGEREVTAAPATGAAPTKRGFGDECPPAGVPKVVAESFTVFQRERTAADVLPEKLTLPSDRAIADHSRRVATLDDGAAYLTPVHGCVAPGEPKTAEADIPGICIAVVLRGATDLPPACIDVKQAMVGHVAISSREGQRYAYAAVPDGVDLVRFGTGADRIEVAPRDNAVVTPLGGLSDAATLAFHYRGKPAGEFVSLKDIKGTVRAEAGAKKDGVAPDGRRSIIESRCANAVPVAGAMPSELTSVLRVLREPSDKLDHEPAMFKPGPQAVRFYEDGARFIRKVHGRVLYGIAAEIVAREKVDAAGERDACEPPEGPGVPGVCLLAHDDKGALGACFSAEQIQALKGFLDYGDVKAGVTRVAGLAPDGVEKVVVDLGEGRQIALEVEDNLYAGEFEATPAELSAAKLAAAP